MASAPHLAALDVDHFKRSLENVLRDVEHRAEANGMLAGTNGEHSTLKKSTVKLLARVAVRQVEGNHQTTSAHAANERFTGGEPAKFIEEEASHLLRVLDQVLLFDDAQVVRGANHVGEIP